MKLVAASLSSTGALAAATLLLRHEQAGKQSAERFAAAALETLLNAIDANGADTGAHVRRVATYALILAEHAELDERARCSVERVALFHDIGKIHEALFDLIHDDAKLSASERRAIATHPQRGADVLAPLCGFYPDLPEGVLSHHERWDGLGYPRGLKGRSIPITARIVAIADTFDAITHSRRYSSARSVTVAHDAIAEARGAQLDPELVDLFLFPPVFALIASTQRKIIRWHAPARHRRTGRDDEKAADVSFRWRPGRHGGRGRTASDQARRVVR